VTTFPKHPAMKAPHNFAETGRQTTRAHARLDQAESTQSKHTSQITTANTNIATNTSNITANTTAINAVNTGSGGTSHENFLGTIGQMGHETDASGPYSHSGIGTVSHISSAPTQSDFNNLVDDYNATNTAFNNAVDGLNALVVSFNTLLGKLQTENYMA
jgi:hypothetical protein